MQFRLILSLALTAIIPLSAQITYPGCDPLSADQFTISELFNRSGTGAGARDADLEEPVQFALHGVKSTTSAPDRVDIYFVQRLGLVKYYNGATKTISVMGEVPVWAKTAGGQNDNGLMGIALHPDFAVNRWMFLWYSPPIANGTLNRKLRLGRFTVTPQNTLDLQSEKVLLEIRASKTDQWHSGGPMQFDNRGDLWIQIGNNSDDVENGTHSDTARRYHQYSRDSTSNDEWGSGNTASMRGGTIRIHPDADGYSIPQGNFWEYWANEWDSQGRDSLALEYRNPQKVLREIYVKGERSNYSLAVHPTKRWLAWGTVNFESNREEFNITDRPIFTGFPYFHANNERVPGQMERLGFLQDPAKPRNNSPLSTGVKDLPPAVPGKVNGVTQVAIGGPLYVYDGSSPSTTKFPPHFNDKWITFDWKVSQMFLFTLDTNALTVTTRTRLDNGLFAGIRLSNPLDAHFGPDGSLYMMNYSGNYSVTNPGFTRIDYKGTCHPAGPSISVAQDRADRFNISLSPASLRIRESGDHEFSMYDHAGRLVLTRRGKAGAEYSFPEMRRGSALGRGVHIVRVKTVSGVFVRNVTLL